MLDIGRISKPHGLRGDVVVELFTNRLERLDAGSVLHADRPLVVARSRTHSGRWVVHFEGVDTIDEAERLRGQVLQAEPLDDPDVLWVHELVGSEVVGVDGTGYGKATEVQANPASDLLVLESGGLVPLRFVVEHRDGRVVIDPPEGLIEPVD